MTRTPNFDGGGGAGGAFQMRWTRGSGPVTLCLGTGGKTFDQFGPKLALPHRISWRQMKGPAPSRLRPGTRP